VTATVTDQAGNVSAPGTDSAVLDTTATAAPTITITTDSNNDGLISKTELGAATTVAVTVALPGTAKAGDTLTITDGTTPQSHVLTAAEITASTYSSTVAKPAEGANLTVTATVTDQAGNVSAPGTDSAVLDTTATAAPTITITTDRNNDGLINKTELGAATTVAVTVALPGTAKAGDTLTITDGTTPQSHVLTAAEITAGTYSATVAKPAEGATLSVSATVTDQAGNVSLPGTDSAVLDTTATAAPTITITTDSNNDGLISKTELGAATTVAVTVALPGTANAGDTLTITDGTTPQSHVLTAAEITAGTYSSTVAKQAEGTNLTVTATVTDLAGNVSAPGADSAVLDTIAPTVVAQTFSYAENSAANSIVATLVASDNVGVTGYKFTATGSNTSADGYYQISNVGVITLTVAGAGSAVNDFEQGTNTGSYSVTALDAAGNGTAAIITLNETNVNEAPTAAAVAQVGTEDTPLTLNWAAFGANDIDTAQTGLSIRITTLPLDGVLSLNGVAVVVNQLISKANIDAGLLKFTPDLNESGFDASPNVGTGNLKQDYVNLNFQVSDGAFNSNTATLKIDITPVADTPTLAAINHKVQLFNTSWETTDTGLTQAVLNPDATSTGNITGPTLAGWTRIDTGDTFAGGTNAFELWSNGDTMANSANTQIAITAGVGNGVNWLELNNADNNGAKIQTLGIERTVATIAGNVYDLAFDYAGRLGYGTDFTRISVLVDGAKIASYSGTSSANALNWENLHFSFVGTGVAQKIQIITDPLQFNTNGRGGMIDDITLTEAQGALAGNAAAGTATQVSLATYVNAGLVDMDGSESLSLSFAGLPTGATIITSANPTGYVVSGGSVTISSAELASAKLQLLSDFSGDLTLNVTATSTEMNGVTSTSTSKAVTFSILSGMGADGNDIVHGGIGNDVLHGGTVNDILIGGAGNDNMTGNAGADTFKWSLADKGAIGAPATDTVTDFSAGTYAAGGDRLDLRDLLQGENHAAGVGNLGNYLHFVKGATDTVVHISSTGAFSGGFNAANDHQVITLSNILLTGANDVAIITDLLNKGKLIVD
ncbi:beta strand repeat-containing protein, partial [Undibacterium sp. Ren11W]|uniref:beta strand repeat-containing protein n=1 Tax=Undibacterium sp. Ren11W TaxID=3413045 RepID=UPI003BF3C5D1